MRGDISHSEQPANSKVCVECDNDLGYCVCSCILPVYFYRRLFAVMSCAKQRQNDALSAKER